MLSLELGLACCFLPFQTGSRRAGRGGSERVPADLLWKCPVKLTGSRSAAGSEDLRVSRYVYGFAISSSRGFFSLCLQNAVSQGCSKDPFPSELLYYWKLKCSIKTNSLIRKAVSTTDIFVWCFLYTHVSSSCLGSQEASEFPCCNARSRLFELTELGPAVEGGRAPFVAGTSASALRAWGRGRGSGFLPSLVIDGAQQPAGLLQRRTCDGSIPRRPCKTALILGEDILG